MPVNEEVRRKLRRANALAHPKKTDGGPKVKRTARAITLPKWSRELSIEDQIELETTGHLSEDFVYGHSDRR